ncbi:hypothetical protein HY933_00730 [Candidatus Falkowbacteria bacterium]|nr:hypothetical protein [Candidatus Falkowbacteria bacterium]
MDAQHVQVVIRRRQEADNGKGCRRGPNGNHGQNLPPQMKLHKPMPGTKRRRNGTHSYESHCPKPKRLKGSSTVKRLPILKEKDEATA